MTATATASFLCGDCPAAEFATREEREAHQDATGHGHRRNWNGRTRTAPQAPMAHRQVTPTASGKFETRDNGFGGTTTVRRPEAAPIVPPTEKQLAYLRTLLAERAGNDYAEGVRLGLNSHREAGTLSKAVVSKAIDALLQTPRTEVEEMDEADIPTCGQVHPHGPACYGPQAPRTAPGEIEKAILEAIPSGRYLVGETYVTVDRPDKGRWAGFIFVKVSDSALDADPRRAGMLNPNARVAKVDDQYREVIATLVEDPKAAAIAFGHKVGRCCICSRTLTDPQSIEAGIGPICASKF